MTRRQVYVIVYQVRHDHRYQPSGVSISFLTCSYHPLSSYVYTYSSSVVLSWLVTRYVSYLFAVYFASLPSRFKQAATPNHTSFMPNMACNKVELLCSVRTFKIIMLVSREQERLRTAAAFSRAPLIGACARQSVWVVSLATFKASVSVELYLYSYCNLRQVIWEVVAMVVAMVVAILSTGVNDGHVTALV